MENSDLQYNAASDLGLGLESRETETILVVYDLKAQ